MNHGQGDLHLSLIKFSTIRSIVYKSFFLLCILLAGLLLAAQPKFYTSVSAGPLTVGQPFQIQYTVEGTSTVEDFVLPNLKKFTVYDSYDSKSTSIQNPGLKVVEMVSKIVLVTADKPGSFVVPGATVMVNGKKLKSNSLVIEVEKQQQNEIPNLASIPVDEISELRPGEDVNRKIKQNLFLKAKVNKQTCFVGEELMITHRLYSRLNTSSEVQKRPPLTGFSIIEMVDEYRGEPETEFVQGLPFNTYLVRQVHAFALQPGQYKVEAAEVSSNVHLIKVDDALNRIPFDEKIVSKSNELDVDVKPLPPDQPENFSGAVGNYEVSMKANLSEIHPGDLVKVVITIKGRGNIPLLIPPIVKWPKEVDTADPVVREEYNKYLSPLEGQKTFEYSFTAPDTGHYLIPAAVFSFFDPSVGKYKISQSDSLDLLVIAGESKSTIGAPEAIPTTTNSNRQMYWFAVVVLAIVSWIAYQMIDWKKSGKKKIEIADTQEPVIEMDVFAQARNGLATGDIVSFYREIEQVIWKKLGESTGVLPSVLNKQNVSEVLRSKGVSEAVILELNSLLKECEWALYVPDRENTDADGFIARTERTLKSI